jgi:hypothetical protein
MHRSGFTRDASSAAYALPFADRATFALYGARRKPDAARSTQIGMCLAFALTRGLIRAQVETSRRDTPKRRQTAPPGIRRTMLNPRTEVLTRAIEGDVTTLVFYPDTGCLRFRDSRGVTSHELRPPHSWFALASASRGVRGGTHAMSEGLSTLLHDFCVKRSRWMSATPRMPELTNARAVSPALRLGHADMHAFSRSLTIEVAAAQ